MATTAKISYQTVVTPAVTALNGMANDATQLVGAECAAIDNTSTLADDYQVQFDLKLSGTTPTAGKQILIFAGMSLTGSLWTGGLGGTNQAKTLVANQLQLLTPVTILGTDATASMVLTFVIPSIRDLIGTMPLKFNFWLTQNTGQALNASGNVISAYPIYYTNS